MSEPDCRALFERITAFLDGELDATLCDELRGHLDRCSPCRKNAEFEAAFKSFIGRACCEQEPDGLRDRMRALLDSDA